MEELVKKKFDGLSGDMTTDHNVSTNSNYTGLLIVIQRAQRLTKSAVGQNSRGRSPVKASSIQ